MFQQRIPLLLAVTTLIFVLNFLPPQEVFLPVFQIDDLSEEEEVNHHTRGSEGNRDNILESRPIVYDCGKHLM